MCWRIAWTRSRGSSDLLRVAEVGTNDSKNVYDAKEWISIKATSVVAQPWQSKAKVVSRKQRTNRCPHRRKEGTEINLSRPAKEAPA